MTAVDGGREGDAAGRGGGEPVGGGIDIDSEEKDEKRQKNLSTCFQGNRELLSISLPPPTPHTHTHTAPAACSDAGTSDRRTHTNKDWVWTSNMETWIIKG